MATENLPSAGVSTVRPAVHGVKNVAFFVENRNGVHLAVAIARALPDDVTPLFFTADAQGEVVEWISQAVAELSITNEIHNISEGKAGTEGWLERVGDASNEFIRSHGVDVVVLFNDRSRRGSAVMSATRTQVGTVLVQDGHLQFRHRRDSYIDRDQNWSYGITNPSSICVWGQSTADFISARDPSLDSTIRVTGAIGISDDELFNQAVVRTEPHRLSVDSRPKFLLADQALSDQGKCGQEEHRRTLVELVSSVQQYGEVSIKPHPSSSRRHLNWLEETFGDAVIANGRGLSLSGPQPPQAVITFYSTAYIDGLKNDVPVIFVSMLAVSVVMPHIQSPLLRNVLGARGVRGVLEQYLEAGEFPGNEHGAPIGSVIEPDVHPANAIVEEILAAEPMPPLPDEPDHEEGRTAALLDHLMSDVTDEGRIALVADDFSFKTGAPIPIQTALRYGSAELLSRIVIVDVRAFNSARDLARELSRYRIVLVNSLASFWRNRIVADSFFQFRQEFGNVYVYAHETEWVFDHEAQRVPGRHRKLLQALPTMTVLCVSQHQAQFMADQGAQSTRVVFNTSPNMGGRVRRRDDEGSPVRRVLMAGTVQPRKGVDLYSQLADLARSSDDQLAFSWAGRLPKKFEESFELSKNVDWLGELSRSEMELAFRDHDVFLLSSRDDPMSLAVLEAAQSGMRIVTYSEVGTSEVFNGVSGYAAFYEYTPAAALQAVRDVLSTRPDYDSFDEALVKFSPRSLRNKIVGVMTEESAANPAFPISWEPVLQAESSESLYPAVAVFLRSRPKPEDIEGLLRRARVSLQRPLLRRLLIALHEEDWPTAQAWSVIGHACRDYGAELRTAAVHCVDRGLEVDTNSKRVHDLRRALDEDARIASEGESVQEGLERDSGSAQLRGALSRVRSRLQL